MDEVSWPVSERVRMRVRVRVRVRARARARARARVRVRVRVRVGVGVGVGFSWFWTLKDVAWCQMLGFVSDCPRFGLFCCFVVDADFSESAKFKKSPKSSSI